MGKLLIFSSFRPFGNCKKRKIPPKNKKQQKTNSIFFPFLPPFHSTHLMATRTDTCAKVTAELIANIRAAGTYKSERVITTAQSTGITTNHHEVINFCANNYLGLADNKELIEAAKHTMDTHGFGMSSVRFICGTQDIHKTLEAKISEFHKTEDTILFPSCFDANAGIIMEQFDDLCILWKKLGLQNF